MKPETKKDDGVAPVVGVMLMIVVTVIIAAVVAGFATGFISGNTGAPNAFFDVRLNANAGNTGDQYVMTIEHLGGQTVNTSELEIKTDYTYTGFKAGSTAGKELINRVQKSSSVTSSSQLTKLSDGTQVRFPYLADVSIGAPGASEVNFGNFDFKSGQMMTTGTSKGTEAVLGFDVTKSENGFGPGSVVNVRIIHKPSGVSLFDKEVRVA